MKKLLKNASLASLGLVSLFRSVFASPYEGVSLGWSVYWSVHNGFVEIAIIRQTNFPLDSHGDVSLPTGPRFVCDTIFFVRGHRRPIEYALLPVA